MIIGFSYSDESMYELSYGTSFDTTNLIRELYLNTNYQYNNFDFNIGLEIQITLYMVIF